jgi:hypothetical protein
MSELTLEYSLITGEESYETYREGYDTAHEILMVLMEYGCHFLSFKVYVTSTGQEVKLY